MRAAVDAIARRHRLLTSTDSKALTAAVRELSARYNDEREAKVRTGDDPLLGARLQFSLARDLPKSREAVVELAHAGLLPQSGPVHLLDVGAGLGATTLGVLSALQERGFRGAVRATLVEPEAKALCLAAEIVPALAQMPVSITAVRASLDTARELREGTYDFVLFGQVLSEDARELGESDRADKHAELLLRALGRVKPNGALVVVEPALRTRTRHLHRVHDRLLTQMAAGDVVFAPCPHQGACGALLRETDWCHEDRSVDLPSWLVPIARGAGLRFQGLTFSYLVLRRDGRTLAGTRVISDLRRVKGKSDVQLCAGPLDTPRLECLDRDAKGALGDVWSSLARGDLLAVPAEDRERGRVAPDSALARVPAVGGGR
jgi:ribosomal protein RSM22 (predicted rRNA methylase)